MNAVDLDPVVLFFLLGVGAGLLRSELRLPAAIYELLTAILLLSIGLKGGIELAQQGLAELLPQILAVLAMGTTLPLLAYPVLRRVGKLPRPDAASLAAHYGSVSVATYAVAVAFLTDRDVAFDSQLPLLLVLLEIPGIVVGVLLAKGLSGSTPWAPVAREVFLGKSLVLLTGGLVIGWIAGPDSIGPIRPLYFDLFKGVLTLFLLEMGLIAAREIDTVRRYGFFLIAFGIATPLLFSVIGALLGFAIGLSPGGTMLLATLAASASYIAAPAAMRLSVPEANPGLSLAASLGVTFPFNILFGIPLYLQLAERIHAALG